MTFTPDRRSIVVGGNFSKIGERCLRDVAAEPRHGSVLSWSINDVVKNCGSGTAI